MGAVEPEMIPRLLHYDSETGRLFWLARTLETHRVRNAAYRERGVAGFNTQFAGKEAFTAISPNGYRMGAIFSRTYYAHRVVWAILHGAWPVGQVDHRNGIRHDNRPENLRLATQSENSMNSRKARRGTSRFRGVSWHPRMRKWHAQLSSNGQRVLSCFAETEAEAARIYDRAALEHHGAFARTNASLNLYGEPK
jgi:hypothetical protein